MTTSLSLDAMSTQEKIKMMELIWDDLCHSADVIPSPDWHEPILKKRQLNLSKDEDSFVDWELAKEMIRTRVHEN